MYLQIRLRPTDEGWADALCGRGGCGTLTGWAYWGGAKLGPFRYSGPPQFQGLPGSRLQDGVVSLNPRAARQWRNRHRIPTSARGPVAWGRREARDSMHGSAESIIDAVTGQSSGVSHRRLSPPDPLPPPVLAKCPECGFVNQWDGQVPP